MSHDHTGSVLNQDTGFDNDDQPGIAQSLSQTEIEDLLYSDGLPVEERLAQLRELRDELISRQSADFGGDDDPAGLIGEIDGAIGRLQGSDEDFAETGFDNALPLSVDPLDHQETLSPDDDVFAASEDDDELDDDDVEDWDEGDDFRPTHDVH